MKFAVLAANGKSGQAFVKECLNAGHFVKAGVFGNNPFSENPNLKVVECDATNPNDVLNLVKGADIIVSLIGHTRKSPKDVQSSAIKNVLSVMNDNQKLISLTGTGVRQPGDRPSLIDTVLNLTVSFIDADRIKDGINHANILKASNVNWTTIRVLKLTNQRKVSKFILSPGGPAKILVSRSTVASAILKVAKSNEFNKTMPVIS